jgi:hypothetical protein
LGNRIAVTRQGISSVFGVTNWILEELSGFVVVVAVVDNRLPRDSILTRVTIGVRRLRREDALNMIAAVRSGELEGLGNSNRRRREW